jgi:UDP-N-acetylglucosamine:LPS N-acetylglucosamine transferase
MNVFFVSLGNGAGHLMRGIAIYNAIQRNNLPVDYKIIGINKVHPKITDSYPFEEVAVIPSRFETDLPNTPLYKRLTGEKVDLVIVDHAWAWTRNILQDMDCRKVLLLRQISPAFLRLRFEESIIEYDPTIFDQVYLIEPFKSPVKGKNIRPIVAKNPGEILSRSEARFRLQVPDNKPCAVISQTGITKDEINRVSQVFNNLPDSDNYHCIKSSSYDDNGIFPLLDYYNGIDLMVSGAGYNTYWQNRFFKKKAIFLPFRRAEENQAIRVKTCADYEMKENGADVLVNELFG